MTHYNIFIDPYTHRQLQTHYLGAACNIIPPKVIRWDCNSGHSSYSVYFNDNGNCYIAVRSNGTLQYVKPHWNLGDDYV